MRALLAALAGGAALLAAAGVHAAFDQEAALRASQAAIGRQIRDYRLRDTDGNILRLASLRGKPLLVNFVYTGCFQVCPTATLLLDKAVRAAERELGPDAFRVATIGFNLPFDTPQAMKDFALRQGVNAPNWHFLSPYENSLPALAADFGFRYERTAAGFDHLLQVSVVDAQGRVYRQLYGASLSAPQLIVPLRELLERRLQPAVPAPAGWLDKLRLVCSVYDPATGTYRFNSAYLVELLVGASIILFGAASVVFEWRRKRPPRV